jgi:hypothetical protein
MKNLFIFAFLFISFTTFAQRDTSTPSLPNIDERLYQVFEKDYLTRLQRQNPFLINRWNFYLDNAWYLTELPNKKEANYPEVHIDDLENINILLLEKEQNLRKEWEKQSIYKIKGTKKALVYFPGKVFTEKLNKEFRR